MENLLDYLMYALCGHNYQVKRLENNCRNKKQWLISFEGVVTIILDEADISVLRTIYNSRTLDIDERERYERLFSLCV